MIEAQTEYQQAVEGSSLEKMFYYELLTPEDRQLATQLEQLPEEQRNQLELTLNWIAQVEYREFALTQGQTEEQADREFYQNQQNKAWLETKPAFKIKLSQAFRPMLDELQVVVQPSS